MSPSTIAAATGMLVDNYAPAYDSTGADAPVPSSAKFWEGVRVRRDAMLQGYAEGTLPRYPEFVSNLFKRMPMLWPQDVMKVIDDMVAEKSGQGVEPYLAGYEVKNRLSALRSSDGTAMHAAIGVAGEGGELLDAVKKVFIYRKGWTTEDKTGQSPLENLLEELGDLRFYYQALLNLLDLHDSDVIAHNYNKLRARYMDGKYSDAQAQARADKNMITLTAHLDVSQPLQALEELSAKAHETEVQLSVLTPEKTAALKQELDTSTVKVGSKKDLPVVTSQQLMGTTMQRLTEVIKEDPDYAWSWHCNIAMAFADEGVPAALANHGAARFMRNLFGVEPAHELPPKDGDTKALPEVCGCGQAHDGDAIVPPPVAVNNLEGVFEEMGRERSAFMQREAAWVAKRAKMLERAGEMLDKLDTDTQDRLLEDSQDLVKWGLSA